MSLVIPPGVFPCSESLNKPRTKLEVRLILADLFTAYTARTRSSEAKLAQSTTTSFRTSMQETKTGLYDDVPTPKPAYATTAASLLKTMRMLQA